MGSSPPLPDPPQFWLIYQLLILYLLPKKSKTQSEMLNLSCNYTDYTMDL